MTDRYIFGDHKNPQECGPVTTRSVSWSARLNSVETTLTILYNLYEVY